MAWGVPILGSIVDGVKEYILEGKKQKTIDKEREKELSLKEHELKVHVTDAKIEMAKTGQVQEYDLDRIATQNMEKSIFDEFMILLILIPVVLCFIPFMVPHVAAGFASLTLIPDWYMWLIVGAYIVKLGMRGLFTKLIDRLGNINIFRK